MKRPRRDEPQRGIFNIEYSHYSKEYYQSQVKSQQKEEGAI